MRTQHITHVGLVSLCRWRGGGVLVGLLKLGVESMALQNSCDPLLNSCHFRLISRTQINTIYHCQNTMPLRHTVQLLTIQTLAFAFCNNMLPVFFFKVQLIPPFFKERIDQNINKNLSFLYQTL